MSLSDTFSVPAPVTPIDRIIAELEAATGAAMGGFKGEVDYAIKNNLTMAQFAELHAQNWFGTSRTIHEIPHVLLAIFLRGNPDLLGNTIYQDNFIAEAFVTVIEEVMRESQKKMYDYIELYLFFQKQFRFQESKVIYAENVKRIFLNLASRLRTH